MKFLFIEFNAAVIAIKLVQFCVSGEQEESANSEFSRVQRRLLINQKVLIFSSSNPLRVGTHYPLTHPLTGFFGWVGSSKNPEKPTFV
jgi:hypothetical protein